MLITLFYKLHYIFEMYILNCMYIHTYIHCYKYCVHYVLLLSVSLVTRDLGEYTYCGIYNIELVCISQGPFDGVMAFSQGASFAMMLCLLKEAKGN